MQYNIYITLIFEFAILKFKKINYRPLDEDKKVKEKFDSIFDVGKYDKCIEQIRKEIKFIRDGKIKSISNN